MNVKTLNAGKIITERPPWAVFVGIFLLSFIAYSNAVNHPFVHDDVVFILQNSDIGNLNPAKIFSSTASPGQQEGLINTYWRPVLELFYRLQYKAFGFFAPLFHLTNVVLHALNGGLLYLLLLKIPLRQKNLPLAVTLIFLLHPVQSESVACVSGISNILLGFFLLASMHFYLTFIKKGRKRDVVFSFLLFFLALLTKEQAVVLPVLLFFYHLCFERQKLAERFRVLGGFFALFGFYFFLRWIMTGAVVTSRFFIDKELFLRLASIPRTLLVYVRSMVFPFDLHYYRNTDVLAPKLIPALLFLLLLGGLFFYLKKTSTQKEAAVFALGWFIITLLPMLNIVPLINEYSLILTADHFLYLPVAGFFLFLLLFLDDILTLSPLTKQKIFMAVAAVFLVLTVYLNRFWRSEVTLFERTLKYETNFGRAHYLLAKAYYFDGQFQRSISHFQKALGIMNSYLDKTKNEGAKKFYLGFNKSIYYDMAHSFEAQSDFSRANGLYNQALLINPKDSIILNNIGLNYIRMNNPDEARRYFIRALALDPDNALSKNNLATLYAMQGKTDEALRLFMELLEENPGNKAALNNLKRLRAQKETE